MLHGFPTAFCAHLTPGGEGRLVLSDFAEHLGARTHAQLLSGIDGAGLRVATRLDTAPRHGKAADPGEPPARRPRRRGGVLVAPPTA